MNNRVIIFDINNFSEPLRELVCELFFDSSGDKYVEYFPHLCKFYKELVDKINDELVENNIFISTINQDEFILFKFF